MVNIDDCELTALVQTALRIISQIQSDVKSSLSPKTLTNLLLLQGIVSDILTEIPKGKL